MPPLPNLTRRFLTILGVAGLLAVGGQLLVQAALRRQSRHYGLVAQMLQNRALGNRAVQLGLALARPAADSAARARLGAELETTTAGLWRAAGALQPSSAVARAPRAVRATLSARLTEIERARAELAAAAADVSRLAELPRAEPAALVAATDRLLAAQRPLAAGFTDGASDIIAASESEVSTLRGLEATFAIALLATLGLGGLLVVRPAARSLESLVRELLRSREEIETAHVEASRERELAASLIAANSDGIFAFDRDMRVTEWNPAMERWTGVPRAQALGRLPEEIPGEIDWGAVGRPYAAALGGRPTFVQGCRARLTGASGPTRFYDVSCVPVRSGDAAGAPGRHVGEITGGLVTVRDVSERKELEARLSHQAYHDPLTGLANRTRFREQVERALADGRRAASSVAVIFVDLDDFKKVNDSLGHAAGDALLTVVGERLLNATRGSDTVARLGGDEFAILVENARTDDDVLTVADRVVRAMRAPVVVDGREVFVGASVGVARAAAVSEAAALLEAGQRADELLRNADVAMYRAKGAGKGRHVLYEQGMLDDALERLELEGELRHAVERGELRVHYQPIVELDGERVTAVEALVRWQHPRLGLVPPARFLSLAEETGLIVPLGRWVMEEACRQVAEWRRRALVQGGGSAGEAPLTVAVNVSGRQIRDLAFVTDVREALARAVLPPDALLLELPERVFMQCTDAELERLRALKSLGVRLGIDDFGTGYASLSYLQKFPVDVLKIDRSFVEGVTRGGSDAALARAVIALSDMLSVRTVAEGVARPQQQEQLRQLGCALGQGYLFAQPLAAEAMDPVLGLRAAERAA